MGKSDIMHGICGAQDICRNNNILCRVVFEKENQWETAEIPGWFSPGDFVIILKNFLLLLERMRVAKIQNVFQNNSA